MIKIDTSRRTMKMQIVTSKNMESIRKKVGGEIITDIYGKRIDFKTIFSSENNYDNEAVFIGDAVIFDSVLGNFPVQKKDIDYILECVKWKEMV